MTVEVRPAGPDDASAIAGVHVRSWQAAYRGLLPDELLDRLSVTERRETWRQALAGGAYVLVALDGGTVVGFCALAKPSRDDDAGERVAEIAAIYVDPEHWRRGIGRELMEAALADLRAERWTSVTLWLLTGNQPAHDFYAQFGLEADGTETAHDPLQPPHIRLRAALSP